MTIQPTTAPRASRTVDSARGWLESRRHQSITAFVVYAVIVFAFFGVHVLPHLGTVCGCSRGADPSGYMWNLAWWPHALLHGLNPFVTDRLFAPDHIDLGGEGMIVPGVAIPLAPVTLLFGPLVTFNLAMLASPVLAAFFAFLLCRYVTNSFPAALFGGYLFGFSAYMLGHLLGHLNLVLIFPIPAGVHLMLRFIDGRISERRFIVLGALDLAALMAFAPELAFTLVLGGGATLVAAYLLVPVVRDRLIAAIKPTLAAGVLAALVTSPVIFYAIKGNVTQGFGGVGDFYGADGLGFLVPTGVIRLGREYFSDVAVRFTAGPAEEGVYVGLPLALIVANYGIARWRQASTRLIMVVLAGIIVLMLGSHLHLAGYPTIPLPWKWLNHSLLRQVVPVRLGVYMFLIVAVILAMWLARPLSGRWDIAKWVAGAVSIAFVFPNLGSGAWHSRPYNPAFFTTTQYRRYLQPNESVLMLPFGQNDISMLWQAETGFWFRNAGGYLGRLVPTDYLEDPLSPSFLPPQDNPPKAKPADVRAFLARHQVGAVIVDPTMAGEWPGVLAQLGLKAQSVGGIWLYRVA